MQRNITRALAVAAFLAAASTAIWPGQSRQVHLPSANLRNAANETGVASSGQQNMAASETEKSAAHPRKIKFYRNPMGLPDTSSTPKKDSMGMDYIPVYEGEDTDDATVSVSPGKIQRTGVETILVAKRPISHTVKAPGVVQLDERRLSVIAPRFDGFVQTVGAATSGSHIMKGDALVTVFSQDILNQAAKLLFERQQKGKDTEDPSLPGGKNLPSDDAGSARRLRNLGVPDEFIERVIRERRVPDSLTLTAPFDGVVLERSVVDGQAFKSGDVLFRLADHSVVWIVADVAETELSAVQAGQSVRVKMRAHPGRTFTGSVAVVYPHLVKETRTGRVRIELQNPDLALLPDMYGDVEIETGTPDNVVAVPSSAVIDSGTRQIVLIAQGDGRYEPTDVKVGRTGDGFTEILNGVSEGDRIVTNGNFLIDAESNLQSALKGFKAPAEPEAKP